jgi:hypothetical protein
MQEIRGATCHEMGRGKPSALTISAIAVVTMVLAMLPGSGAATPLLQDPHTTFIAGGANFGGAAQMARDGRTVALSRNVYTNGGVALVEAYTEVHDLASGRTVRVENVPSGWFAGALSLSPDGTFVATEHVTAIPVGEGSTRSVRRLTLHEVATGWTRDLLLAEDGSPVETSEIYGVAVSTNGERVTFVARTRLTAAEPPLDYTTPFRLYQYDRLTDTIRFIAIVPHLQYDGALRVDDGGRRVVIVQRPEGGLAHSTVIDADSGLEIAELDGFVVGISGDGQVVVNQPGWNAGDLSLVRHDLGSGAQTPIGEGFAVHLDSTGDAIAFSDSNLDGGQVYRWLASSGVADLACETNQVFVAGRPDPVGGGSCYSLGISDGGSLVMVRSNTPLDGQPPPDAAFDGIYLREVGSLPADITPPTVTLALGETVEEPFTHYGVPVAISVDTDDGPVGAGVDPIPTFVVDPESPLYPPVCDRAGNCVSIPPFLLFDTSEPEIELTIHQTFQGAALEYGGTDVDNLGNLYGLHFEFDVVPSQPGFPTTRGGGSGYTDFLAIPAAAAAITVRVRDSARWYDLGTIDVPGADDTAAPTVVGVPDRAPDQGSWYLDPVTIDWQASDPSPSSGSPTDPADTFAGSPGFTTYTSDPSCDPRGNCATGSLALNLDLNAPTPQFSNCPAGLVSGTPHPVLEVVLYDDASGVVSGSWSLDGSSPAAFTGDRIGVTLPPSLGFGEHVVAVSGTDAVGRTGSGSCTFIVYGVPNNPSTLRVTPGSETATVSWTAPTRPRGGVSYEIEVSSGGVVQHVSTVPGTDTSTTIGSLSNGVPYSVRVRAVNPAGVSGWTAARTVTPRPLVNLSVSATSFSEDTVGGGSVISAYFGLDRPTTQPVTFTVRTIAGSARSGRDYVPVTATITIPAGEQYATLPVQIVADFRDEADETFSLRISSPTNAALATPATIVLTILDND